jgi:hypothetical protein
MSIQIIIDEVKENDREINNIVNDIAIYEYSFTLNL